MCGAGSRSLAACSLAARLVVFLVIRLAQDQPAVDRQGREGDVISFVVLVDPCGSDARPEGIVAFAFDHEHLMTWHVARHVCPPWLKSDAGPHRVDAEALNEQMSGIGRGECLERSDEIDDVAAAVAVTEAAPGVLGRRDDEGAWIGPAMDWAAANELRSGSLDGDVIEREDAIDGRGTFEKPEVDGSIIFRHVLPCLKDHCDYS